MKTVRVGQAGHNPSSGVRDGSSSEGGYSGTKTGVIGPRGGRINDHVNYLIWGQFRRVLYVQYSLTTNA